MPFLLRLLGGRKLARSLLAHAPALGLVGLGKGNRDLTKERFIAHALEGHPADEITAVGRDFAEQLMATRMNRDVLERLAWHRDKQHETVMISASLDVYLQPIAERLEMTEALTTRLEIVDGRSTGRLVGANVRAGEKVRRLGTFLSDDHAELWAYGNSSGDHEMLMMADHPFWVDRSGRVSEWKNTTR